MLGKQPAGHFDELDVGVFRSMSENTEPVGPGCSAGLNGVQIQCSEVLRGLRSESPVIPVSFGEQTRSAVAISARELLLCGGEFLLGQPEDPGKGGLIDADILTDDFGCDSSLAQSQRQ